MKSNAYLNNQDLLHWFKTPEDMKFTEQGYPILEPCSISIPRRGLITKPFNYALNYKGDKSEVYIHFYIQDYLFNRIWNDPLKYLKVLRKYKGIVMPDFSMFYDMPLPLQQFNHYRNLWFARMCQIEGIDVIPSPNWSDYRSHGFCFDGLPKNNIIMLSAVGSIKQTDARENFNAGLEKMLEELNPTDILFRTTKKLYASFNQDSRFKNCNLHFVDYIV